MNLHILLSTSDIFCNLLLQILLCNLFCFFKGIKLTTTVCIKYDPLHIKGLTPVTVFISNLQYF